MQQLLVKLTSLQFFFNGILFFLWTLRGKHQQKPLPFRKQRPQSYDAARAYHLLQVNVKKQINDFSYNMPCILHRKISQRSQSKLFLLFSPSQISCKKQPPCSYLLEFPRVWGKDQAQFWGRLATDPTTEKLRSQNHKVAQTPRLPERQKWPSVFYWKGPWAPPEVPETHWRQCNPSKRMLFSVALSLTAAGNEMLPPSHLCRCTGAEHPSCTLVIA